MLFVSSLLWVLPEPRWWPAAESWSRSPQVCSELHVHCWVDQSWRSGHQAAGVTWPVSFSRNGQDMKRSTCHAMCSLQMNDQWCKRSCLHLHQLPSQWKPQSSLLSAANKKSTLQTHFHCLFKFFCLLDFYQSRTDSSINYEERFLCVDLKLLWILSYLLNSFVIKPQTS